MSRVSSKDKEKAVLVAERATRLRPKVPCYYKKCNGKLVDTRTRQKHVAEEDRLQASISIKKYKEKETNPSIRTNSGSRSSSIGGDPQILDDDIIMNNRSNEESSILNSVSFRKKRKRYD
jgi:hypothetical protein